MQKRIRKEVKEESNVCLMVDGYTDSQNRSLYAANVVGCKSRLAYLLDLIDLSLFSHTGIFLIGGFKRLLLNYVSFHLLDQRS